jgi:GT2 family glycosyltransferase
MKEKLLSIILINYNGLEDTLECIESINKSKLRIFKIIVIDNASIENPQLKINQRFPEVELILNNSNMGFAAACNQGIDYAIKLGASYIWLLNNDTIIDVNTISELVTTLESDEKIGLVSGVIYHYDQPQKIWYAGGKVKIPTIRLKHYTSIGNKRQKYYNTKFISGCCMLFRTDLINEIGKLNEKYFFGGEDMEYSILARRKKKRLVINKNANIWHKIGGSTNYRNKIDYWQVANMFYNRANLLQLFCKNKHISMIFIRLGAALYKTIYNIRDYRYGNKAINLALKSIKNGYMSKPFELNKDFFV